MAGRDERGVAPVIGFILVFSFLILAFTVYQGVLVPDQNRQAEFEHSQTIQGQMQDLRNAIMSAATGGTERTVTVRLGAQYPRRTLARNLGYSGGSLRTTTFSDDDAFTITNATTIDQFGEASDYWNGTSRRFRTTAIGYEPVYSFYSDAPSTFYANTLAYNTFDSANLSLTPQSIVEGNRITLVSVVGNLSRSGSGTVSIDPGAISTSTTRVSIRNETNPITVTIPTQLPVDWWRDTLSPESASEGGHVTGVRNGGDSKVIIVLESNVTYTLRMAKIGVGTGAREEPASYLTLVDRPSGTVFNDTTHSITLEARDRFNNPVGGVKINGTVAGSGSFSVSVVETGSTGRATFEFVAGDSGLANLRFNISGTASTAYEEVWVNLSIRRSGGGGTGSGQGSSSLFGGHWLDPSSTGDNTGANFLSCDASDCVWEATGPGDGLLLRSVLNNTLEGVNVDFAVNNSTVGTVSPSDRNTDSAGEATTELTAHSNGTVAVYLGTSSGADQINITTTLPAGSTSSPQISFRLDDLTHQPTDSVAYLGSFDVSNTNASFQRVEIEYANTNDGSASETLSKTGTRGSLEYNSTYGATDEYDITVRVIYDGGSGEYVAASRTITDTADASNPAGNDDLGSSTSATLSSSTIEDRSSNGQGPQYRFDYQVSASGSFSEVRFDVIGIGGGHRATLTDPSRSGSNVDVNPDYGYGAEYKLSILVFDADGAVVDVRVLTDTADGTDP